MKKKLLTLILVSAMSFTGMTAGNVSANVVYAEGAVTEVTDDNIAITGECIAGEDRFYDLSVGEEIIGFSDAVDSEGNILEFEKDWVFCSNEDLAGAGLAVQFYSTYDDAAKASDDPDRGDFEGVIPTEAFGKYVYKWIGVCKLDSSGNPTDSIALKLLRSVDPVTDWGDTDYQTYALNSDKKTVSVYTIYNAKNSFSASFQKSITVGGKKYKVTAICNDALDNTNGYGMKSVTIHSGITAIEKNAFKGAKNLKTITIQGKLKKVGKNAFKGINKKAVFKIKASKSDYNKIVKMIKKSGVAKTVTFKKI